MTIVLRMSMSKDQTVAVYSGRRTNRHLWLNPATAEQFKVQLNECPQS